MTVKRNHLLRMLRLFELCETPLEDLKRFGHQKKKPIGYLTLSGPKNPSSCQVPGIILQCLIFRVYFGAGELAQLLRLVALAEDPGSIPGTYKVAHNCL